MTARTFVMLVVATVFVLFVSPLLRTGEREPDPVRIKRFRFE